MDFLQKYEQLKRSIPVPAVSIGPYTIDSEFVEYVFRSKNCKYCYNCIWLEDSIYCKGCWGKELVDCNHTVQSELCYESVDCTKCYNCTYCHDCNNCTDCYFCVLCNSCSECFGCVGLTRKKHCIFNKQYTKEGYQKKIKKLLKEKPDKILKKVYALKKKVPHPQSRQSKNLNCPYGDYLHSSKNVYWGFNTYALEDSGYVYFGGIARNCWDMYWSGDKGTELSYELNGVANSYHCGYLFESANCRDCYFGAWVRNCSDCWGCVGLTNKKYCVLNNQLTKQEYEKAICEIKKELGWHKKNLHKI